ncbi:MAG TPA: di-trans,poly-cis-decaprenylcistransferase [Roseomonas sp.]
MIMDGNGRWATGRGLPRAAGHRAGVNTVRRIVEAAPEQGVGVLTLYAFSSDNWGRPKAEVAMLMALLSRYLRCKTPRLLRSGVRVSVIGRRDRLSAGLAAAIERIERETACGDRLRLRIALDYSARDAILAAARCATWDGITREDFAALVMGEPGLPAVDLLIRAGGEKRLSDFLLWESAYAELWFTERLWPDFGIGDLVAALADFRARNRRFGLLPAAAA